MTPDLIDSMGWAMAQVYGAVTDRILINLARHFKFIKQGAPIPKSWEYQVQKLAEMGQVTKETEAIILQSLEGADAELQAMLEAAIMDGLKTAEPAMRKAAKQGLLHGSGLIPPELTPNQMQAFQAYYRQSADKLNLVNTVMLESTQAAYTSTLSDIVTKINTTQGILNTATGEVVTGVESFNNVLRTSVNKMVDNGLTGFIDHGGHHWSPEAYVAMDVRTTVANTAREAVFERMVDYGDDLYIVSYHNGARPLCYPWQLKVISRSDWSGEVEDLDGNKIHVYAQSETSYGEAAGLFGINCKHYPSPFIPGVSTIHGHVQDKEENDKAYAESQEQRRLERDLRNEKRELEVMKAQGATDEEINAQKLRVKNARTELNDFCDETGRSRVPWREKTPVDAQFPKPEQTAEPNSIPTPQLPKEVKEIVAPDTIEQALNVQQYQPMSIEKALEGSNPKYGTSWGYDNNCQRCVQAYEMRRRGYPVEALPKKKNRNTVVWGSECFEGYGTSTKSMFSGFTFNQSEAQIKDVLANSPNGARYSIYIKWNKGSDAHVFVAENVNGVIKYIDPQSNKSDVSDYFNRGWPNRYGYFRMDDKNITSNGDMIKATMRKAD